MRADAAARAARVRTVTQPYYRQPRRGVYLGHPYHAVTVVNWVFFERTTIHVV